MHASYEHGRAKNFEVIWPVLSRKPENKVLKVWRQTEEVLAMHLFQTDLDTGEGSAQDVRRDSHASLEPRRDSILLSREPEGSASTGTARGTIWDQLFEWNRPQGKVDDYKYL
jgi:hypothetical protein